MFVGRTRELKKLQSLYNSNQFEFAVFYGRRRVGKTTLINEFIKDKKAVYYMAVEGTRKENLSGLSKALLMTGEAAGGAEFLDYTNLFNYIDTLCQSQERLIIVIDEYPYLAASYPAVSSMLQSHIDQCWKNSKLFLILCGSSMSFMEEQVLGRHSLRYIHSPSLKPVECFWASQKRHRQYYMALQEGYPNIYHELMLIKV